MVQCPLKERIVKQLLTLAGQFNEKERKHKCAIILNVSTREGNLE